MKSIYRKLKDYIHNDEYTITTIFGDLMSINLEFHYQDEKGEWIDYRPSGAYYHECDFLLEYYVCGIHPEYRIENNKIIPYLSITLDKEKPIL